MPIYLADATARNPSRCLHIGLLNNMPDGALEATERQFLGLLETASRDLPVRFSLFCLPDVPRAEWGRNHVNRRYAGLAELWESNLDGLIVTGTEPRAENLADEPYWGSLTEVIGWAREETYSAVWSCLAAHAVLQHLDGIRRSPLGEKRFGVFPCARECEHRLTAGLPGSFSIPHSRWNDIPEDVLSDCGYDILTRLDACGADAWAREEGSLFVFLQGHPEYEAGTLLLEYRRDIARYLKGERKSYPSMPDGYFDAQAEDTLMNLRARILAGRQDVSPADFPASAAENVLPNTWRPIAARFYANWLRKLAEDRASAGMSRGRYLCAASAAGD